MKDLQTTELTGTETSFENIDTIFYCCSSVKIDDANFYFQILKDVSDQSRTAYY